MKNCTDTIFTSLILTCVFFIACKESKMSSFHNKDCMRNIQTSSIGENFLKKGNKTRKLRTLGTLTATNSGTDEDYLELAWDAPNVSGIPGHFEILKKLGQQNYQLIAVSNLYHGSGPTDQFIWRENDPQFSSYIHKNHIIESSLPLRNSQYRVLFHPLNQNKRQKFVTISNEVSSNRVPKDVNLALEDIAETIQHVHKNDCGLFKTVFDTDDNQNVTKEGSYSGFYTRYIDKFGNLAYYFSKYANNEAIEITGELKSHSVHFKSKGGQNYIIPRNVNGDLNISGIYDATLSFLDVGFADPCGKSIEKGLVKLTYKHPQKGSIQGHFVGLQVPLKLLSSQ